MEIRKKEIERERKRKIGLVSEEGGRRPNCGTLAQYYNFTS